MWFIGGGLDEFLGFGDGGFGLDLVELDKFEVVEDMVFMC